MDLGTQSQQITSQPQGISPGRLAWRRLKKNRFAMACLGFLVLLAILAVLTPFLPLQPPRVQRLDRQFARPTFMTNESDQLRLPGDQGTAGRQPLEDAFGELDAFNRALLHARIAVFGKWSIPSICGTDQLGRDVLSRLFWGARVSLMVGLVATMVSLIIGVSYGAIAGYMGGRLDNVMMRFVDMLYSVPFIFVVIFIITILDVDEIRGWREAHGINRMVVFFFLVGAIYWLTMARVVRGQVISLREYPFVEAARSLGASRTRIIFFHLVPNLLSIVIVYLTLTIPNVMLFEAFLSFLGLGVRPPDVSWGILADEGIKAITPIRVYWWLVAFPSLALGLTLFALNFLGDGLRDALDPRLKNAAPGK